MLNNSFWSRRGAAGIVRRFIKSDDVTVSDDGMMSQREKSLASCSHCDCMSNFSPPPPSPRLFSSLPGQQFPCPSICQPFSTACRPTPAPCFLFLFPSSRKYFPSIHSSPDLNELVSLLGGSPTQSHPTQNFPAIDWYQYFISGFSNNA